ncbi:MAG TPA: hypothetical protein VJU82_07410 [Acidobacteriaceae bacterium]|nr:hypothetical protein [Acidobacteriaceae bacterium]
MYRVSLLESRPDKDERLLEGSACVLRVMIEPVAARRTKSDAEMLADPFSWPPLMLTVGRPFLSALADDVMGAGYRCRIEPPARVAGAWSQPKDCSEPGAVGDALAELSRDAGCRTGDCYPITCWFLPERAYQLCDDALNAFQRSPGELAPWRRLIHAGVMRVSVTDDSCSIAMDCSLFPWTMAAVSAALRTAGLPVERAP